MPKSPCRFCARRGDREVCSRYCHALARYREELNIDLLEVERRAKEGYKLLAFCMAYGVTPGWCEEVLSEPSREENPYAILYDAVVAVE